jgi:hypothetical protein
MYVRLVCAFENQAKALSTRPASRRLQVLVVGYSI